MVDLLTSPSIGSLVLISDIASFVAVPTAVPPYVLALTSITDVLVLALVPTTDTNSVILVANAYTIEKRILLF